MLNKSPLAAVPTLITKRTDIYGQIARTINQQLKDCQTPAKIAQQALNIPNSVMRDLDLARYHAKTNDTIKYLLSCSQEEYNAIRDLQKLKQDTSKKTKA